MNKGDLVRIWWIDAWECAGWVEHKRKRPKVYPTVGILVDQDEYFLYYASTPKEHNEWSGYGRIPKGMVVRQEVIEESAPTWKKI